MEISFVDSTGRRHGRVHVKHLTVIADEDAKNAEIEISIEPVKGVRGASIIHLKDSNGDSN